MHRLPISLAGSATESLVTLDTLLLDELEIENH